MEEQFRKHSEKQTQKKDYPSEHAPFQEPREGIMDNTNPSEPAEPSYKLAISAIFHVPNEKVMEVYIVRL